MKDVQSHFTEVAHGYTDMRTKDLEPLDYIKKQLDGQGIYMLADIGAGCGRYSLELLRLFDGSNQCLFCVDCNGDMLKQIDSRFKHGSRLCSIKAFAEDLPFIDNYLDCVVTFNAIHHFDLLRFFEEVNRVLKDNRNLFVYTRLGSQNKKSIWGTFFPSFHKKESRLYEIDEIGITVRKTKSLHLKSVKDFRFERHFTLDGLVKQALNHHYSTFCLYDEAEFGECLGRFKTNIKQNFDDLNNIVWDDEYSMIEIEKGWM